MTNIGIMNKERLVSHMRKHKDRQQDLAEALGISLSCLNAKINEKNGFGFKQTELCFIKERYKLSAKEMDKIFFARVVS